MTTKVPPYGRGARALKCRECGTLRSEGAQISARALCSDCGKTRANEAADQLHARSGPHYEEWRRGIVAHAQSLISN